jgi:hypothetical protein
LYICVVHKGNIVNKAINNQFLWSVCFNYGESPNGVTIQLAALSLGLVLTDVWAVALSNPSMTDRCILGAPSVLVTDVLCVFCHNILLLK